MSTNNATTYDLIEPIRRRLPSASAPDSGSSMAMTPAQMTEWKTKMGYGGRHSRRGARRGSRRGSHGGSRRGSRRAGARRGSRRSCRR